MDEKGFLETNIIGYYLFVLYCRKSFIEQASDLLRLARKKFERTNALGYFGGASVTTTATKKFHGVDTCCSPSPRAPRTTSRWQLVPD
jgi:hypothetical protein